MQGIFYDKRTGPRKNNAFSIFFPYFHLKVDLVLVKALFLPQMTTFLAYEKLRIISEMGLNTFSVGHFAQALNQDSNLLERRQLPPDIWPSLPCCQHQAPRQAVPGVLISPC